MTSKRMKTGSVAIIDIGSNTIRVCVYRVNAGKSSFKKVIDARDFVGLSSYVNSDGVMSSQGIIAGGKAVAKMVCMARMAGFDQVHAFATAALRNCANSYEGIIPSPDRIENVIRAFCRYLNESSVCVSKYSSVCAIGGVSRLAAKVISLLKGEKSSGKCLTIQGCF